MNYKNPIYVGFILNYTNLMMINLKTKSKKATKITKIIMTFN